jgi:HD superfamily phosphodiesterase
LSPKKAEEIASQVQASIEKAVSGALLHDVADTTMLRSNPEHESASVVLARQILHDATFSDEEIEEIIVQVLGPHSCYPDNMPQTLEAKVLATADALGHLSTEFYDVIKPENMKEWFDLGLTAEEHRQWVLKKIDRDFYNKIFFENIRKQVRPRYEELKNRFQSQ